jgi:drug/metabolite transporter (DMT)-like permease
VLAFACVAVMSAFGKAAKDVPTGILVFFQNFISLVLFTPWALGKGVSELRTSRTWLHILRAAAGLLSQVLMFVAVKRMPLVNAVLLSNSAPLFIPLVTWVWLKERIGGMVWVSLLIGFAGVILILKPGLATAIRSHCAHRHQRGGLLSLGPGRRQSTLEYRTSRRILFYYFLYSSAAAAPFAVLKWRTPTDREWLLLGGIGLMMAASQLLIILAYKHATAGRIAPFNYTVVIFSGLIGWVVWNNTPDLLSLYRLGAAGDCTLMQSEVICSNGSGWSPDGRTMYYIESFRYAIFAYDFDVASGTLSRRRTFVAIDRNGGGFPDGMTVDAQGFVWCCLVGLGRIHRYSPDGELERVVLLPVPRATDCTFGGPDLGTLYVTSARETMTPEELVAAPLSGSLFAIDTGIRGLASTAFAG